MGGVTTVGANLTLDAAKDRGAVTGTGSAVTTSGSGEESTGSELRRQSDRDLKVDDASWTIDRLWLGRSAMDRRGPRAEKKIRYGGR
jgi:hypothetical protein